MGALSLKKEGGGVKNGGEDRVHFTKVKVASGGGSEVLLLIRSQEGAVEEKRKTKKR